MAGAGENDGQMELLFRAGGVGLVEHGPDLEEANVADALAPVVLDPTHEPRQQPTTQVRFLGREGVQDGDGIGGIRGPQRKRARLEQAAAAAHQCFANPVQGQLRRRVGDGAGTVGPQLVRECVVATEPCDLFDEIDLACDVRAPAGHLHRQPVVLRRDDEPDRREVAFDFFPRHRDAEEVRDARIAHKDAARLLRFRPNVDRRLAHCSTGDRANQIDRAVQRVRHGEHVDAPLEAVARFARDTERATRTANSRRLEVRAFEHDVRRALRHLRLGAAHDARDDRRALGVADRGHLSREFSRDAIERDDLLTCLRATHDHGRSTQPCQIEGVQRLVHFEQDVVRGVDDVVDRSLVDCLQAGGKPHWTRPHLHPSNNRDHISRRTLGIFEAHFDTINNGVGRLEGWKVLLSNFPTFQLSTGYFRQLHRRSQTHRQFPGDSFMTQQIRPIRRHVNDDLLVGHGNRVEKRCARRSVGLELENARLVDAQAKLFCGAEHPVRFDAADLAALELEAARQRRTDGREGIGFPGMHVRRTADHFERRTASGVDEAECEPVGVGMLAHLEHARDEDVAQVLMDWHYTVDGSNLPGQSVSDVLTLEWPTEQRL